MTSRATKKCAQVLKSESSFLFLALSILSEEGYPAVSAICAAIGPTNFLRLVKVLSGASFKVPSGMELSTSLLAALYLYHQYVEPMPDKEFAQEYDVDVVTQMVIKKRAKKWASSMKDKGLDVKILLNKAADF